MAPSPNPFPALPCPTPNLLLGLIQQLTEEILQVKMQMLLFTDIRLSELRRIRHPSPLTPKFNVGIKCLARHLQNFFRSNDLPFACSVVIHINIELGGMGGETNMSKPRIEILLAKFLPSTVVVVPLLLLLLLLLLLQLQQQ